MFFFFFQAEDGIRDVAVTGVQTCALPISRRNRRSSAYDGCQPPGAEGGRTVARKGPAVSRQKHPGTEQNRSLAKAQVTPSDGIVREGFRFFRHCSGFGAKGFRL